MDDVIVYDDGLGNYIGLFTYEDGSKAWYRWPATDHGWKERKPCNEPDPDRDAVYEYGDWQARLALKLSGVTYEASR